MNDSKYKWILYIILAVIISTITIQIYWNYKNYLNNKQQFVNDVQISLDKAVDDYYTELAQKTTVGFSFSGDSQKNAFKKDGDLFKILGDIDETNKEFKNLDSLLPNKIKGITVYKGLKADSLLSASQKKNSLPKLDSTNAKKFGLLTSKVIVSIHNDTLVLKKVDSMLKSELSRKNIIVDYSLTFKDGKEHIKHFNYFKLENDNLLQTTSKSTFLPKNSELILTFKNVTLQILKRSFTGILVSTLLILTVVGCLFYLLKIITNQKQLAEVKNDLISNITHEFKTPIATIGVAIESIKDFNVIDNREKTKTYLDMSSDQLSKLNVMVEKLLETATLDSDSLELNKEQYNITEILHSIVNKHKMQTTTKTISFSRTSETITAKVDIFHFENAINNILDNAIKYGGNEIEVSLSQKSSSFTISISDNGNTLSKANKDKIFEKFYRIPKGNTHDIKGFGIGLYYAKKIIEKHDGVIILNLNNNKTTFNTTLPNE